MVAVVILQLQLWRLKLQYSVSSVVHNPLPQSIEGFFVDICKTLYETLIGMRSDEKLYADKSFQR